MTKKHLNKTILITGASSGIGEEAAYHAAESGAQLILGARRLNKLEEVKEHCEALGSPKVHIFPLDIGNPDNVDELIHFLEEEGLSVDVLINNAGFGHDQPFVETDFSRVVDLFKINVIGLMYLTQKVAVGMVDQGEGQIINIASLAGKVSTPNYATYGATKGAVISFSNALRMELNPFNIQITVVNFGPVDTPFFDHVGSERKDKADGSPFTLTVKQAGKIVFDTIGTKKREVNRPLLLDIGARLYNFTPQLVDYVLIKYYNK